MIAAACGAGRPRSPEADAAIVRAALEQLVACGFEGTTVEAVAARAGVAKSTVYRRYPGKLELLTSVLALSAASTGEPRDTGSVGGDLVAVADQLRTLLNGTTFGAAVPALVSAAARHPEVAEVLRTFVHARREPARAALARGIERGEVRGDVDVEGVIDAVVAPVFYRMFVLRQPVSRARIDSVVELALAGVRTGQPAAQS